MIEGSESNVVGLPLELLAEMLEVERDGIRELGIRKRVRRAYLAKSSTPTPCMGWTGRLSRPTRLSRRVPFPARYPAVYLLVIRSRNL